MLESVKSLHAATCFCLPITAEKLKLCPKVRTFVRNTKSLERTNVKSAFYTKKEEKLQMFHTLNGNGIHCG